MDTLSYNSVLAALSIKEEDKIILIRENKLADSNFVITHSMKQIFANRNNKVCLVTMHNDIKHYVTVGKRLGYDLQKKIDEGYVRLIEPLKSISNDINKSNMRFIRPDSDKLAGYFLKNIENEINVLRGEDKNVHVYLILDDLSYMLDMKVGMNFILPFINTCINIEQVSVIANCHVASKMDELLANSLEYICDVKIELFQLKTGRSIDVTGILTVSRPNTNGSPNTFHFKAYDRGIKVFKPGETINFL